ncbi:Protein phosphatase 2C-like protein C10F6.17c [Psilocybe cubensis]|uniref:Protein phosphatase 2C-like protein C10F6.17c n=2 Tax=Psilocybe cubensis TaxID=181762 RepID=A0ACB8GHW4_PSICU|nr:Protein phosphatase 2C-like protein C10F6.17c [Psilocybe cubensis]KAH9474791.1 Protein phosphatase 2C-like protein C10F6.17c [Psilocybe cubensis]
MTVGQTIVPIFDLPEDLQIHVVQYQHTERPIEDRYSVNLSDDGRRLLIGVYDGHGGPETADHISQILPSRLLAHPSSQHAEQFELLDNSMISNFKKDHSIFRRRSSNWVHNAQLMKSGSAALVLDVDLSNLSASYANLGDCRLVLCDSNSSQKAVSFCTTDLNMNTPSERERLIQEHPKEDYLNVGGRLFGRLMCTRGFGDGYYKLPKGIFGSSLHRKYIDTISSIERKGKIPMNAQYASLFYAYKTPPYITAWPDTGNLQLKKGDVVILATDGLWDLVSTEDATRIVLQGMAEQENNLAKFLLEMVKATISIGDDVTILVYRA